MKVSQEHAAALRDAAKSYHFGSLTSRGRVWVGEHPETATEHRDAVIRDLKAEGFLILSGRPPAVTAAITEEGRLMLDLVDGEASYG